MHQFKINHKGENSVKFLVAKPYQHSVKKNFFTALLIATLWLLSNTSFCQIKLTGIIKDSTNLPLEFVTIAVKQNNSFIGSAYTDQSGFFQINLTQKGNITITANLVGYKKLSQDLDLRKDTMLKLILSTEGIMLKEVTIKTSNNIIEAKADRLVFNVERSTRATGGDAIDALAAAPKLLLKNEGISMIGKGNVQVMINDKLILLAGEELMNYLKTINSSEISKIEVISNPPAKYSAEGSSGLVNIILKKAIRDSWSCSVNSSYKKNSLSSEVLGMNYNYRKKTLSLFCNISSMNTGKRNLDVSNSYFSNQTWSNESPRNIYAKGLSASMGIDKQFTDKLNIGIQYIGAYNLWDIDSKSITKIRGIKNTSTIDSIFQTISSNNEKLNNHSINLNSTYKIDSLGKKVRLNLDGFQYTSNTMGRVFNINYFEDYVATPGSYFAIKNSNNQRIQNYAAQVDFELPIKRINFDFGGRISNTKTLNGIEFYTTTSGTPLFDSTKSNNFNYFENNQALYINCNRQFGEKFEVQMGLRGENTQTKGVSTTLNQIHINNYFKLFPTIYFSYKANENNTLQLNYSRRIGRPNYSQLNPFRTYKNPYSYVEGNPTLQPNYSDNLEINHIYKKLTSTLFWNYYSNCEGQVVLAEPNTNKQLV